VQVWTVNHPATARPLWDRGVAGMVTDYPAMIRYFANVKKALGFSV
jgi:hypothetical protein